MRGGVEHAGHHHLLELIDVESETEVRRLFARVERDLATPGPVPERPDPQRHDLARYPAGGHRQGVAPLGSRRHHDVELRDVHGGGVDRAPVFGGHAAGDRNILRGGVRDDAEGERCQQPETRQTSVIHGSHLTRRCDDAPQTTRQAPASGIPPRVRAPVGSTSMNRFSRARSTARESARTRDDTSAGRRRDGVAHTPHIASDRLSSELPFFGEPHARCHWFRRGRQISVMR